MALLALGAMPGVGFAQNAQEEVDKQIAKAISDAINTRVTSQALAGTERKESAPPNNFWASYGQIQVKTDATSGSSAFDFKIPTYLVGYDRDIRGKTMVGVSLSYYTFSDTIGTGASSVKFSSDSFGVSPYVAWLFSENYFSTLKINVGFGSTESSGTGFTSSGDLFNWGLDLGLNGIWRTGDLIAKGLVHVGYSYSYVDTTTTAGGFTTYSNTSSDQVPYGLEGELGYMLPSRTYLFGGLAASQSNKSGSYGLSARAGFDQRIGKNAAIALKYEKRIDDNSPSNAKVSVESFFITGRIGF